MIDREKEIFFNGYERGFKDGKRRMFEKILYFFESKIYQTEAEIEKGGGEK